MHDLTLRDFGITEREGNMIRAGITRLRHV